MEAVLLGVIVPLQISGQTFCFPKPSPILKKPCFILKKPFSIITMCNTACAHAARHAECGLIFWKTKHVLN
jgi:hypothetical protein